MATQDLSLPKHPTLVRGRGIKAQRAIGLAVAVLTLLFGAAMVMLPLVWMFTTSIKTDANATSFPPQWIPRDARKVVIEEKECFVYAIPVDGQIRELAQFEKTDKQGVWVFVNPEDPTERYNLAVKDGTRVTDIKLHFENYPKAMTMVPFMRYVGNTMIIVVSTTIGMLISCVLVAYGFSRFRARWLDLVFLVMLSTIMLPPQVTLIPTFVFFSKIGWYDTYWPIIIPSFFANAWDVFLLRQFFMTVPIEMDEAARIDGAGPIQVLLYVLIPQAWPAIATVSIFHFLWAWNDFFTPLIYIQSQEKWTLAMGLQSFNGLYSRNYTSMMAATTVAMLPCLLLFFIAQKLFIQGVVVSGIKG